MNCAERAYADLCGRMMVFIREPESKGWFKGTGTSGWTSFYDKSCRAHPLFSPACLRMYVRGGCIGAICENTPNNAWIIRSLSCGESCAANRKDFRARISTWTTLGRMARYDDYTVHFDVYSPACFVCHTSRTERNQGVFCGSAHCTTCVLAFTHFAFAMWAVRQVIPADEALCLTRAMVMINLSLVPA